MKVILPSCHFHFRAHILLPDMQAIKDFIVSNAEKIGRAKIAAGEFESLREFYEWYDKKWKREYPDLYDDRFKRRRLTEVPSTPNRKRKVAFVTPSPKRARTKRTHIPAMPRRMRSRRPVRRLRRRSRSRVVRRRKSFKKVALRKAGEGRKRGAPAKRVQTHRTMTVTPQNKGNDLYAYKISDVAQGDSINQRERQAIDISGFKIRYLFKNTANDAATANAAPTKPLLCNMAIVWQDGRELNYLGASHFFRTTGVNRYTAFNADTLSGWDKYTYPMNIDADAVLWHTRFKLGAANTNGGFGAGSQNTWRTISRYIKIGRRAVFHGPEATSHEGSYWLLVWCNHFDQVPTDALQDNTFIILGETNMYFRDPGV